MDFYAAVTEMTASTVRHFCIAAYSEDGPLDLEWLDDEHLDEAMYLVERTMCFRAKLNARYVAEIKSILEIAELVERRPGETPFLAAERAIEEHPEQAAEIQRRLGIAG